MLYPQSGSVCDWTQHKRYHTPGYRLYSKLDFLFLNNQGILIGVLTDRSPTNGGGIFDRSIDNTDCTAFRACIITAGMTGWVAPPPSCGLEMELLYSSNNRYMGCGTVSCGTFYIPGGCLSCPMIWRPAVISIAQKEGCISSIILRIILRTYNTCPVTWLELVGYADVFL